MDSALQWSFSSDSVNFNSCLGMNLEAHHGLDPLGEQTPN